MGNKDFNLTHILETKAGGNRGTLGKKHLIKHRRYLLVAGNSATLFKILDKKRKAGGAKLTVSLKK